MDSHNNPTTPPGPSAAATTAATTRNYRPLRPAPPTASRHTTPQQTQPEEPPAKRKVTEVACQSCRTRKSKCDGASPQCATCVKRGTDCVYPGVENPQALRRKYQETELLLRSHQELYDVIQNKSEEEGFEIVRRIRRGHDVDAIMDHIRDGDLLLQALHGAHRQNPAATTAAEARRRPSIQAMLEDASPAATTQSRNSSSSPSLTRSATDAMSILAVCQAEQSNAEARQ